MHQISNPGRRTFSSLQTGLGPHHSSTSLGTKVLSPVVKRPEREVEHSHSICCRSWEWVEQYLCSPVYILDVDRDSFSLHIRPIFFFDFHITRRQQVVYVFTFSTTVRILFRVLGGTEPCIWNSYVSESALNTLNSSAFLRLWITVNCLKISYIEWQKKRLG